MTKVARINVSRHIDGPVSDDVAPNEGWDGRPFVWPCEVEHIGDAIESFRRRGYQSFTVDIVNGHVHPIYGVTLADRIPAPHEVDGLGCNHR